MQGIYRLLPYETSGAAAAQLSLGANPQHVAGSLLAELQDQLTLKRQSVFSWLRTDDAEQSEPVSAWLAHETVD